VTISAPVLEQPIPASVRETAIEGRFRRITTHQLCLAWWCHTAGHITRRQLRVWFAAHEMHERRRYTARETSPRQRRGANERKPYYGLEELKTLVGGRGSATADAELTADLRHLAKLRLVVIEDHAIRFAVSADQLALDDLSGFWAMFNQLPNPGRGVPVPRRTLRALAGGFSRAVTGVMIALMIRSLFWHRDSGDYRVDGRTKGSWIAEVFGLSRRAVTDARARLIELGWLEAIETSQWELNRWGAHDFIHVEWSTAPGQAVPEAVGEGRGPAETEGESASPTSDNRGGFASPCLNISSFPSERNLKTNNLDPGSGPAGVSGEGVSGKSKPPKPTGAPSLRNILPTDLRETGRLLDLYHQAVAAGRIPGSEAGRLDFFALAERASSRGHRPGALFHWLLGHKRFDFITQADEDAAQQRLRELRQGPREVETPSNRGSRAVSTPAPDSEADKIVRACLLVAERRQIADPFTVAKQVKPDWTRVDWDTAVMAFETARMARLAGQYGEGQ
jgi:hypothetical protein